MSASTQFIMSFKDGDGPSRRREEGGTGESTDARADDDAVHFDYLFFNFFIIIILRHDVDDDTSPNYSASTAAVVVRR